MARFDANLAAAQTLRHLRAEDRAATPAEQAVLARWGSWGAQGLWQIFDENRPEHVHRRHQLREVLTPEEYDAARRTTINAHYTDAAYVSAIWTAMERLGITRGAVLEPGCGAGTFIGAAPAHVQMVGVELDPVTAGIARHLYPDAAILTQSFADTRLPVGYFDATIGNVPFADVVLHDPRFNPGRYSMHNHFILKSLELTRPGGIVAVLTSHHTLDSRDAAHRRDMHHLADLVGAVRLPTGAHAAAAGTDAVTDLLILRRRLPDEAPLDDAWVTTQPVELHGPTGPEQVRINRYFAVEHRHHVLGQPQVRVGMYGVAGLHITPAPGQNTAAQLQAALQAVTDRALEQGRGASPAPDRTHAAALLPDISVERDGHITATTAGGFTIVAEGVTVDLSVPTTQRAEVRALLGLRDQAKTLIATEAANRDDTVDLAHTRTRLGESWHNYVARYGPINRYTMSTPTNPQQTPHRLIPPAVRLVIRHDPYGPLLAALERFDDDTHQASPAHLLLTRQIVPREPVTRVDAATDAVSVTLDTLGRLDLDHMAQLLDTTPDQARHQLLGHVFDTPPADGANPGLVTRAEYLSGDVRTKLDVALAAAADDPDTWAPNVAALREVLPPELGPGDITARLGAVWIPDTDHTAFMRDVLGDRRAKVTHISGSQWVVEGNKWGIAAQNVWGTQRMAAPDILERLITQTQIVVKDHHTDVHGNKVETLNVVDTEAAQEKAQQLSERFSSWVWEDPDRAERLQAEYNRRFNSVVLRDYTGEGAAMALPGLVKTFTPRPHQRGAVARMLNEPSVGLFHEVGAGKTAEMIMGAMELKRLGMVQKPLVVVPNHMLEQFSREWLQLYPQATLLAAGSKDLTGDRRREFVARAATNDWDGIVLTRGAFERIPLSPQRLVAYLEAQSAQTREDLARIGAAQGKVDTRLKAMEKQILRKEEQAKAELDKPRDPGITFEETGIDYLIVDELHDYKNLTVASAIPGASILGSGRARDLDSKIHYLRSTHGARVITGATATPIANSVTEMYVMQRYLAPTRLTSAGIHDFDSWAATFGEVVTGFEANITGDQFKLKGRFAKFTNVPELLTMFHEFGDIKTAADLDLPVPRIGQRGDGQRLANLVSVEQTDALSAYIGDLSKRVDKITSRQVDPRDDNMLKVASDGRKAALDMRLVTAEEYHPLLTENSKVDVAAAHLAQVWAANKDRTYPDPATGEDSSITGALQLVFCDLSTPSTEKWNVYDALRDQLYERGLPHGSVRFIHEAENDDAKARLFADARAGKIAVLMGSTQKMGVGTNIQDRAIHLMDLDAPWRPADVAQRHGRIIRQGNLNPEIQLTQLVTVGSFDTYMWQTLERKGRFIDQIMRGTLSGGREIEDISEATLSSAEFKAIASGNPLLLEQARAEEDLRRYTRLEEAHRRNEQSLSHTITRTTQSIDETTTRRPLLEAAVARTVPTAGDAFAITINGRHIRKRADAADHLQQTLRSLYLRETVYHESRNLITLGGHNIHLVNDGHSNLRFIVDGLDSPVVVVPFADIQNPHKGTLTKLENLLSTHIPTALRDNHASADDAQRRLQHAHASLGHPFKHADALTDARQRYEAINQQIASQDPITTETTPTDQQMERLKTLAGSLIPQRPPRGNSRYSAGISASQPHVHEPDRDRTP